MSVFDKLQWMEEELWEEEEEETEEEETEEEEGVILRPRMRRGPRLQQAVYADEESMDGREAVFIEEKKRKGRKNTGLKFLILLELLGILAVVWWWIKWLY